MNENIKGVIEKESHKSYVDIADKLIENCDPRDVVAALLKMHYESDFDQTRYKDIIQQTRENRFGNKGSTTGQQRLFVALGRREGYTARSLLELITNESGVQSRDIDDLKMMDDFSFITVSAMNAAIITNAFANKTIHGKKAIINRAKESTGGERRPYGEKRTFGRDTSASSRPSYPRREGERKEF